MTSCLGFALKYFRKIMEEGRHQRKQIGQMFITVEAALMVHGWWGWEVGQYLLLLNMFGISQKGYKI